MHKWDMRKFKKKDSGGKWIPESEDIVIWGDRNVGKDRTDYDRIHGEGHRFWEKIYSL